MSEEFEVQGREEQDSNVKPAKNQTQISSNGKGRERYGKNIYEHLYIDGKMKTDKCDAERQKILKRREEENLTECSFHPQLCSSINSINYNNLTEERKADEDNRGKGIYYKRAYRWKKERDQKVEDNKTKLEKLKKGTEGQEYTFQPKTVRKYK